MIDKLRAPENVSSVDSIPAISYHKPNTVHSSIAGLLKELPFPGAPWPGKKLFKEAFLKTLDFLYPDE